MLPDRRLFAASVLDLPSVDGAKKKQLHDLEAVDINPLETLRGQCWYFPGLRLAGRLASRWLKSSSRNSRGDHQLMSSGLVQYYLGK